MRNYRDWAMSASTLSLFGKTLSHSVVKFRLILFLLSLVKFISPSFNILVGRVLREAIARLPIAADSFCF